MAGLAHRVPHEPHAVTSVARSAQRAPPSGLWQHEPPEAQAAVDVPHTHCAPAPPHRSESGPQAAHEGPHPEALVDAVPAAHVDQVPPAWQVRTPARQAPADACWHACVSPGVHARIRSVRLAFPDRPAASPAVAVSVTAVPAAAGGGVPRSVPVLDSTESHEAAVVMDHAYGGTPSLASSRSPYGIPATASASCAVTTVGGNVAGSTSGVAASGLPGGAGTHATLPASKIPHVAARIAPASVAPGNAGIPWVVKTLAHIRYAALWMRWTIAAAVGASLSLLSCTQPEGQCGPGGTCPEGQTCHLTFNICYVPDAPVVTWASPQVGETLTGETASVSGIVDFGGGYAAEISAGRPDAWQPLGVSTAGQFSTTLTLPSSNGEPQPLRIRITEPASSGGRVTVQSIYRAVDNVPPSLAFSEAASRPTPTTVRIAASEPLAAATSLPQAVPVGPGDAPVTGRWNADRTELRFEGLAHDETYRVDVPAGALADRAGHATASAFSVTFTTEPMTPAPDTTVAIGALDLTDLEASSDAEGAVSVVVNSSQGTVVWGEFDTRTGLFRTLSQAAGTGLLRFQAVGAPTAGLRWDDGTSKRASGMMMSRAVPGGGAVQSLTYEDVFTEAARGTFVSVNPGGLSYLPDPGTCYYGGPVTLEVEPGTGLTLFRAGGSVPVTVSLPAPPSWALYHSDSRMEWVSEAAGTLYRLPRACACRSACPPGAAQVVASGATAGARISVADTANDDRAYVYDTASGRALTCLRDCSSGTCTNVGSENATVETAVANANQGSSILQAERSGTSVVLYQRDLSQGCGGGPTPAQELGRLTTGSSVRAFRPVMFGRRPGLLYLSTAGGPGVLRAFIP